MKYCTKCGTANDDQAKYCFSCGTPFAQERKETSSQSKGSSEPSGSVNHNSAAGLANHSSAMGSANQSSATVSARSVSYERINENELRGSSSKTGSVADNLRELITSRTYEVAMGALLLRVVFSIISSIAPYSGMGALESLLYNTGLGYYMNYFGGSIMNGFLSGVVENSIRILVVVGLWLQYSYAKDENRKTQTTGFRIHRVLVIIEIVLIGIGILVIMIAMGKLSGLLGEYGGKINALFLLAMIVLVFVAAGYICIYKLLDSAIGVIEKGTEPYKCPRFVSIYFFILGVFIGFCGVLLLVKGSPITAFEAFSFCTGIVALAMLIGQFNELDYAKPSAAEVSTVNAKPSYSEKPARQSGAYPSKPASSAVSYAAKQDRPEKSYDAEQPQFGYGKAAASDVRTGRDAYNRQDSYANRADAYVNRAVSYPDIESSAGSGSDYRMEEGTMMLDGDQMIPLAKLVRLRDQRAVRITKKQFTIGKATEGVDYSVDGNPAVSRRHAEIVYRDGGFYIIDTNSTNHVYVDERMIPPGMPVRITDGTRIRLGNEMFQFSEN